MKKVIALLATLAVALSLAAVPVWADESTEFRYSFLPIDVTVSSFSDGYSNINSCSIVKNIDLMFECPFRTSSLDDVIIGDSSKAGPQIKEKNF